MSISSRDVDKNTGKSKDHVIDRPEDSKKYIRLWRIEASREFVLLSIFLLIGMGFMAWNPLQANLNTEKILQNQDINSKKISDFFEQLDKTRTVTGLDIIKVLLLYNQDFERDLSKLMKHHGVPNVHFVDINGTHALTEEGAFKLPFNINMTSLFNQTRDSVNGSMFASK